MAVNGVKDNKCFVPINPDGGSLPLTLKQSGTVTDTIPAGAEKHVVMVSGSTIAATDSAIVTFSNLSLDGAEQTITETHEVLDGYLMIYVDNPGASSFSITINYLVLGLMS